MWDRDVFRLECAASYKFDPALKAEILKGGARDFVQKPYDPNEIMKRIREVIDRNKS